MQIEKDLLRTLTNNVCFATIKSTGIPRLRRILRGLAWLYPDIGYCQASSPSFSVDVEKYNCFHFLFVL